MKKWTKERYAKELEDVRKNGKYGLGLVNPHPEGAQLIGGRLMDSRDVYQGYPWPRGA
jgi:hypothetical protein